MSITRRGPPVVVANSELRQELHSNALIGSGHDRWARLHTLIALALMGGLVACGFQLRGEQTLPFSALYVYGNATFPSLAQIRQTVAKVPGTRLVNSLGEADAELKILNENRDRVISALSAAGRVVEYELRLKIIYELVDKQGNDLIHRSEIQLFRLVPYDVTQVLSKGQEEALLYTDMQNDAVAQIMRRLAAAKPRS
jgi:LPS-assembly lipoprotein